jgi:hypothetical protein
MAIFLSRNGGRGFTLLAWIICALMTLSVAVASARTEPQATPPDAQKVRDAVSEEVRWLLSNQELSPPSASELPEVVVLWSGRNVAWCESWLDYCQTAEWSIQTGKLSRMVQTVFLPRLKRTDSEIARTFGLCSGFGTPLVQGSEIMVSGRPEAPRPAKRATGHLGECPIARTVLSVPLFSAVYASYPPKDGIQKAIEKSMVRGGNQKTPRKVLVPRISINDDKAYVCVIGISGDVSIGRLILWHTGEWRFGEGDERTADDQRKLCHSIQNRLWFELELSVERR